MDPLTAADVRRLGPPAFDWTAAGYPPAASGEPDRLQDRVDEETAVVLTTAGRTLAGMPLELEPIARKAIVLSILTGAMEFGADALEVMAAPWLKSFTAGSYSETRFSPGELAAAKGQVAPGALGRLLWLLMTDEKRQEFMERESGEYAPAMMLREDDYGMDSVTDRILHDPAMTDGLFGYEW